MKFLSILAVIFCSSMACAQGVIPVINFNNFFLSFSNGFFNQIEVQAINGYKGGDELVAYIDTLGNLRLYD